MKKFKKLSKLLISMLILSIVVFTGCGKKDGSKDLVVSVGDTKVYMDEMMFYIYMTETQLNQIDQMYQAYMGTSYWDQEYSEGVTVREYSKTSTMDMAVQYEILYAEAIKAGNELSDEDKAASKESIGQIMSSLSEAQLEKTGLTEEIVTKVWNKTAISYNYTNNLIEGFDIDDEKIRAGINKSDYKQYDTQSLFISTMKYDEEGKSSEMTDKEKSEAKNKIEALLDKAKAGDDFSTLVTDNEDVTSTDRSFLVNDESTSEEYKEAAMKLKNNQVSEVLEMEDGYYIIKMVEDDSDESYEAAVSEAIKQEENTRFQVAYEELKKNYEIKINNDVWDELEFGNITTAPVEDPVEDPVEEPVEEPKEEPAEVPVEE